MRRRWTPHGRFISLLSFPFWSPSLVLKWTKKNSGNLHGPARIGCRSLLLGNRCCLPVRGSFIGPHLVLVYVRSPSPLDLVDDPPLSLPDSTLPPASVQKKKCLNLSLCAYESAKIDIASKVQIYRIIVAHSLIAKLSHWYITLLPLMYAHFFLLF